MSARERVIYLVSNSKYRLSYQLIRAFNRALNERVTDIHRIALHTYNIMRLNEQPLVIIILLNQS